MADLDLSQLQLEDLKPGDNLTVRVVENKVTGRLELVPFKEQRFDLRIYAVRQEGFRGVRITIPTLYAQIEKVKPTDRLKAYMVEDSLGRITLCYEKDTGA